MNRRTPQQKNREGHSRSALLQPAEQDKTSFLYWFDRPPKSSYIWWDGKPILGSPGDASGFHQILGVVGVRTGVADQPYKSVGGDRGGRAQGRAAQSHPRDRARWRHR